MTDEGPKVIPFKPRQGPNLPLEEIPVTTDEAGSDIVLTADHNFIAESKEEIKKALEFTQEIKEAIAAFGTTGDEDAQTEMKEMLQNYEMAQLIYFLAESTDLEHKIKHQSYYIALADVFIARLNAVLDVEPHILKE